MYTRLLKNQWLKEGGDILNKSVYQKYNGSHLFSLESFEGQACFGGTTDSGRRCSYMGMHVTF